MARGPLYSTTRREFLTAAAGLSLASHVTATATLKSGFYFDGLSSLPDRPGEIRSAKLDAFICDVSNGRMDTDAAGNSFYHRTFELCDQSIDAANRTIQENAGELHIARTGEDIKQAGAAVVILQFQGCEPIGGDLSRIEYFHNKSLRVLQLTHNESNACATAYTDERSGVGLSPLGIEAVTEMNRVGIVPDASHASVATTLEAVRVSKSPVILSHGACRSLLPHPRGATDEMIRSVADSGGVFGVFMMSFWLTEAPTPTVEHYLAHIRHAVQVAGIDAVGIANDNPTAGLSTNGRPFDNATDMHNYAAWWESSRKRGIPGFGQLPKHAVIPELNNINRLELIHRALLRGGFSASEADKLMGDNWARFFKANLR